MKLLISTMRLFLISILILIPILLIGQQASIQGRVMSKGEALEYALVSIPELSKALTTDDNGLYLMDDIPYGTHTLSVSYVGYEEFSQTIVIDESQSSIVLNIEMQESNLSFDAVVVTGTKTFKRKTNSAVIVNIVDSKKLNDIQACNLSEGLKFQPGLRVETDCQTCNYTQLRINGLTGGYSQVLINGRPIFSPFTGLYGLEQLPSNMIDRIEVIRGGGSSLYGSSAIGGTVNVLTKIPKENSYEIGYNYQNMGGASDHNITANTTHVNSNEQMGISFFLNNRNRDIYDHNDDNFSEIPEIKNTSIGSNAFFLFGDNQKLELSLSKMYEYRYGGEMVDKVAYLTQQSEERTHDVWMSSADYQINFNDDQSSLITYLAWQNTDRLHYTGILPDDPVDLADHIANPPNGTSNTRTLQGGLQLNHAVSDFLNGKNVFTLGTEYLIDDTYDEIESYNYLIDQTTKDLGIFVQSDWEILPSLNLLSGIRMDKHNLVDELIFSPRASLLYKYNQGTQVRFSYGSGFRAPQAFDTDLHIAFAGGGVSRVILAPELVKETSDSYSLSINSDRAAENYVAGFTLEGFYTTLENAFILNPVGEDEFGEVFEKQNGQGAKVLGTTIELRANYDRKIQVEAGMTIQQSRFNQAVSYIDEVPAIEDFIRTPNQYGYASISFTPTSLWDANLSYAYTGSMIVPHFSGAPNQTVDEIVNTQSFSELNFKLKYILSLPKAECNVDLFCGIKNIFNAYQNDFDIGKNRDSNYVYGPAQPRTFFVGFAMRSL